MDANEINQTQDNYDRIAIAIEKAIRDDRTLVTREAWVSHLCDFESITRFAVTTSGMVFVNFKVYTQMTGGSFEWPEAEIPLDTLNKYL
jgi:hypothetical protein